MNPLALAISDSSIDEQEKLNLQEQFDKYFQQVDEWKDRAMKIVVTSEEDLDNIERAKEGKKFMQNIRLNTEDRRKLLKAPSLEYGRTIDAIAKVITEAIAPIEKHLEHQYKQFDAPKIEKVVSDKDKLALFIRSIEKTQIDLQDKDMQGIIEDAKNKFIKLLETL